MTLQQKIAEAFESEDCRVKILPAARADEAVGEMLGLHDSGRLNPEFAARYRKYFRRDWRSGATDAKSVLLVAAPAPMLLFRLTYKGVRREVIAPPTYYYSGVEARMEQAAEKIFAPAGVHYHRLEGVPLKLLAVRSGLCTYGRNNITYCEGLGSYIRLIGFETDLEPEELENWRPAQRMPECEDCSRCLRACPTGAIDPGREIIRGERCLTYYNENGGEFPDWMDPGIHHALAGCLRCQAACPKNRGMLRTVTLEDAVDEADIDRICEGGELVDLPEKLRELLCAYDLDDCWDGQALARNLRALRAGWK